MNVYKESGWAGKIISLQHEDGSWGYFHSLSYPSKSNTITTEQALRCLEILGFTIDDAPIQKAVSYMHSCLAGENEIPDRSEKLHDWDLFTSIILSAWIRRFTTENNLANHTAGLWAEVVSSSFKDGTYQHDRYVKAYKQVFKKAPRGGRFIDFVQFYVVSLLSNYLDDAVEEAMFDYILSHDAGIYYIYGSCLLNTPEVFGSKQASRYIGAIELLSEYKNPKCKAKLRFVTEWLNHNREPDGSWDLGATAKDGVYFPLSDSWRNAETRKKDCTYRISKLLRSLGEYE
ncbi:MAG: hypothetical protein GX027_09660 [Clostridiaceae bacterium]|jgi:hypothetical protein|nr:hypothetical protein [Clostridiaceae bacterium]